MPGEKDRREFTEQREELALAILQLRFAGDPVLRQKCRPVEKVTPRVRGQLLDMLDTLRATPNGAALAAPQEGLLRRLVVIEMGEGPLLLADPRIVCQQGEQQCTEGCLSLPGRLGSTVRPVRVTVEALDQDGDPISFTATGAMAKCICHELDHLEGILFSDRALRMWTPGDPDAPGARHAPVAERG